jgi:hypothetical protein
MGGFLRMSQVIRYILVQYGHINFGDFDISGLLYFIINIPIPYMADSMNLVLEGLALLLIYNIKALHKYFVHTALKYCY